MEKPYTEHKGKVVETDNRFKYVMAIALNPKTGNREGVIRCITIREGDITIKGNIDRSELHKIKGSSLESFKIGEKLDIKNETEIINKLAEEGLEFIGLEDPDIWIDEKSNLLHLYFTLPLISRTDENKNKIHLGHAIGKDLNSLEMTMPVLLADKIGWAKELSIAPINKRGFRYNLVESSKKENDFTRYSVIKIATAEDMGKSWKFGEIVFHPKEHDIPWIGGHASPGPLFSKNFIDVGEGKLLGLINGREANQKIGDKIKYGMFSIGLFIYDYENGKIDWVSPEPFIQDSEAKTITFASQFIETKQGEGILYAHVDDSFIRAYTLNAESIRSLLPNI